MDKILKQFGEDKIKEAVINSNSFVEATLYLGLDPKYVNIRKNVERSIKRLKLSVEHFESIQKYKKSKNRWNEENLKLLVDKHNTFKSILEELNILPIYNNYRILRRKLTEFNIDFSKLRTIKKDKIKWSKENLELIVKESISQKDVLSKLGIRTSGGNFKTLHKYIKLYNLDTSHFIKSYEVMKELKIRNKLSLEEILVENSEYNRYFLKERLYSSNIKERKCELCGQDENWRGKKMSLIIDHINGVHNDNRLQNLRIVCPNCNATLETHCKKNKKR